jgi:hypothetical protein
MADKFSTKTHRVQGKYGRQDKNGEHYICSPQSGDILGCFARFSILKLMNIN